MSLSKKVVHWHKALPDLVNELQPDILACGSDDENISDPTDDPIRSGVLDMPRRLCSLQMALGILAERDPPPKIDGRSFAGSHACAGCRKKPAKQAATLNYSKSRSRSV